MVKIMRKIVEIDEELCNGCGQCIPQCAEGAIQIINGKAKLISDVYCDGLGACLGSCPQDALRILEKEVDAFSEEAVHAHLERETLKSKKKNGLQKETQGSQLQNWPVQLRLVTTKAPFFSNSDLLVTADCAPFAYRNFHDKFLAGRSLVVGCPKFDDVNEYVRKLGEILKNNSIQEIIIVRMEVPCCSGLRWIVDRALELSGNKNHVREYIVTVKGELKEVKK